MPPTLKQLGSRRGAFPAAVAALLVGAAIVVEQVLQFFVGFLSALSVGQAQYYGFPFWHALLVAVPFAAGYFLSLWTIAPIAEEQLLPRVIARAVLATAVAAAAVLVALAVGGVLSALSWDGAIFGQSFPLTRFDGGWALSAIGGALTSAAQLLLTTLPLGVLAGVLLWIWRKDQAPRHPVSGLVDEV